MTHALINGRRRHYTLHQNILATAVSAISLHITDGYKKDTPHKRAATLFVSVGSLTHIMTGRQDGMLISVSSCQVRFIDTNASSASEDNVKYNEFGFPSPATGHDVSLMYEIAQRPPKHPKGNVHCLSRSYIDYYNLNYIYLADRENRRYADSSLHHDYHRMCSDLLDIYYGSVFDSSLHHFYSHPTNVSLHHFYLHLLNVSLHHFYLHLLNVSLHHLTEHLIDLFHHLSRLLRNAYERATHSRCFETVSPTEKNKRKEHMKRIEREQNAIVAVIAAEPLVNGIGMPGVLSNILNSPLRIMLLLPILLCSYMHGSVSSSNESVGVSVEQDGCTLRLQGSWGLVSKKITLFSDTTTRRSIYKSCENSFLQNENKINEIRKNAELNMKCLRVFL